MIHPIEAAALSAGFLEAKPATAHPFELWREKLASLPIGKYLHFEHRPEMVCGWPIEETTVWAATFATAPFEAWPDGYGEISNYYMRSYEVNAHAQAWEQAVQAMGYEIVGNPVLPDRAIAIRAGLGVHGLFGPLITRRDGSFVYIATLLAHMPPPEGAPGPENDACAGCEKCGKCKEACPTGAISDEGVDALKCLRNDMSHPEFMPESHFALMGRRILGCDTCQKVCPRNEHIPAVIPRADQIEPFELSALLREPDMQAIATLIGPYVRKERFQFQAVLAAANTRRVDLLPEIKCFTQSEHASLRRAAEWAVKVLSEK